MVWDATVALILHSVVFGWMTLRAHLAHEGISLLGWTLPLSPLAALLLSSLLIPRASFVVTAFSYATECLQGHLSGIAFGYLLALDQQFQLDLFSDIYFVHLLIW